MVELYDLLIRTDPSPVVELNRAIAVAMRDGPLDGLILIDATLRGAICQLSPDALARVDL